MFKILGFWHFPKLNAMLGNPLWCNNVKVVSGTPPNLKSETISISNASTPFQIEFLEASNLKEVTMVDDDELTTRFYSKDIGDTLTVKQEEIDLFPAGMVFITTLVKEEE